MRLPFQAESVADVRSRLKHWMSDQHFTVQEIDDARVIVSELLANAIRHARPLADGTLAVTWCCDGSGLQISVTDGGGATRPHAVDAPFSALGGRGLAIIDTIASNWWSERTRSDSTVHAVLSPA